MRHLLVGFAISSALLTGCSTSDETSVHLPDANETKEAIASADDVIPNKLLTVEIEGMVCQMGCGGSIRKELNATGAVANCEFDFEDGRATNTASIAFNDQKISESDILEKLGSMNEGQFTVREQSSLLIEEISGHEDIPASNNDTQKSVSVDIESSTGIAVPNLLDILSSLI